MASNNAPCLPLKLEIRFSKDLAKLTGSAVRINSKKPKRKKEKKRSSHAGVWIQLHPNFLQRPLRRVHVKKKLLIKYFSLLFTLFEPYGAVFIMNSKIHLRKNSSNEYFKTISHSVPCLFTLGLYESRSINGLISFFSRWSWGHRSFAVTPFTARISSHLSNWALLCLQPTVICLRNTQGCKMI